MQDTNGVLMINSVTNIIKSTTIWKKLVKTIKNSNIDIEKLMKDSIEYGLNVGLFHQDKTGKVESLKSIKDESTSSNSHASSSGKYRRLKHNHGPNLRSLSQSESESISFLTMTQFETIQTRQSTAKKELKRSITPSLEIKNNKRRKYNASLDISLDDNKLNNVSNDQKLKSVKMKPLNREMARAVPICAYCLGDELLNKRTNIQENMIVCWDCGTCAHPTCLQWPRSLLEKVRTIRWQCLQCKCCSYCGNKNRRDDDMLLCDACDQGFHMYCLSPPIKSTPKGQWICRLCRPLSNYKDKATFFSENDFNFSVNCQIVTSENVMQLCKPRRRLSKAAGNNKSLTLPGKKVMKSSFNRGKGQLKMSLLHMKKKKLLEKAVQRQKLALTDGLSMFFTPGDKRQSRVSKHSLSSNSINESPGHRSHIRERISPRAIVSANISLSPSSIGKEKSVKLSAHNLKSLKVEMNTKEVKVVKSESRRVSSQTTESVESKDREILSHHKYTKKHIRKSKKEELRGDSVVAVSTMDCGSTIMSRTDQATNPSIMFRDNSETDPDPISDMDRQWYSEIQDKVAELLPPPIDTPPRLHSLNRTLRHRSDDSEPPELSVEGVNSKDSFIDYLDPAGDIICTANQKFPPRIQIGKYVIDTWYSAPYPSEYARLNVLYICEYCLKHIKSYDVYVMHAEKCIQHFPPGNEIYRNGDISVFEVDGYVSKLYCQQLCLLAKLFLDHKTLYYDVEPFLFYVAVLSKNQSCHIIGYFSKEKRSTHKYNLSCIMVLPPYQKYNYGRFLIDFSYLLSRKEGEPGSPEKPLSTLGRLSYESYWKSRVIPYLLNRENVTVEFYRHVRFSKPPKGLSITIDRISAETGINPHDVASTIQMLSKTVDLDESDRITIQLDWDKIKSESEKYASRFSDWIPLNPDCLRWGPLTQSIDNAHTSVKESLNDVIDCGAPKKDKSKPNKITKILKESKSSVTEFAQKSIPKLKADKYAKDYHPIVIEKKSHKRKAPKANRMEGIQSSTLSLKMRSSQRSKNQYNERTIVTRNQFVRQCSPSDFQIVTRHRGSSKPMVPVKSCDQTTEIKVDLTCSDNSDDQSNDDEGTLATDHLIDVCDIKKARPMKEISKETMVAKCESESSKSKLSPSTNINEQSPGSTGHNSIRCPILLSPEIDLEEETEADLILSGGRRPLIILEKCDDRSHGFIDLCDDTIPGDSNNDGEFDREMTITVSDHTTNEISGENISSSADDSQQSDNADFSLTTDIEFLLPALLVKETGPSLEEVAPVLSRVSSQGSNSVHQDDSSNSLRLPSDISNNEEFKRFYNDGHVFNSITTSHTDSSEKDADESLLSMSNSDLDMNGAFSCDSSICCQHKTLAPVPLSSVAIDDQVRCSPCQSDLVASQVSSTTPFVTPTIVWNASIKSLSSLVTLSEVVPVTKTHSHHGHIDPLCPCDHVLSLVTDTTVVQAVVLSDQQESLDKDVVSSSHGNIEDDVCVEDEELVVSSMAGGQVTEEIAVSERDCVP